MQWSSFKRFGKKVKVAIATGIMVSLMAVSPPTAGATDWNTINTILFAAINASNGYNSVRNYVIAIGNEPMFQQQTLEEDLKRSELDTTPSHNALVNAVMTQLIEKGDYVLRSNSLPFRYRVNNSEVWNAACYPTNYITINRGLVEDLGRSEDALAAILGHEMTHGAEQHLANDQAKAFLTNITFAN